MIINTFRKIQKLTRYLYFENFECYSKLSFQKDGKFNDSKTAYSKNLYLSPFFYDNKFLIPWDVYRLATDISDDCNVVITHRGDRIEARVAIECNFTVNGETCGVGIDFVSHKMFFGGYRDENIVIQDYERYEYPEVEFYLYGELAPHDDGYSEGETKYIRDRFVVSLEDMERSYLTKIGVYDFDQAKNIGNNLYDFTSKLESWLIENIDSIHMEYLDSRGIIPYYDDEEE